MMTRAVVNSIVQLGPTTFRPSTPDEITQDLRGVSGRQVSVGYINPHVIEEAKENPEIVRHLANCDHVCIDGVGVSLALRFQGIKTERCAAHYLLDVLLDEGLLRGRGVVVGIEADLVGSAARAIETRSPSSRVDAALDGFASDSDVRDFLHAHADADFVLIGAGSPKSESIANIAASVCSQSVIFHCGAGSLATLAGARTRTPNWVWRSGLSWLMRIVTEPHTRERYLKGIPAFAGTVWSDRQKGRYRKAAI